MSAQADSARQQEKPTWSGLVLGLVLIAAGIVGLIQIAADPFLTTIDAGDADPGPAFFPRLLLVLLVACGIGQCSIMIWRAGRSGGFAHKPELAPRRLLIPLALAVSVYIYARSLPFLGYLTASIVFAVCWLAIIGQMDRSLPKNGLASATLIAFEALAMTAILYAVFVYAISVPLP
jgi:hypothetical protein